MRFSWKGTIYEFQVLCFGLASAPRVFTKVLKPVFAFFRKIGIRCIYYIDDSLNMNQNFDICAQNTETMVQKLDDLGLRINLQTYCFLLIIDTVVFKIFLTEEKNR